MPTRWPSRANPIAWCARGAINCWPRPTRAARYQRSTTPAGQCSERHQVIRSDQASGSDMAAPVAVPATDLKLYRDARTRHRQRQGAAGRDGQTRCRRHFYSANVGCRGQSPAREGTRSQRPRLPMPQGQVMIFQSPWSSPRQEKSGRVSTALPNVPSRSARQCQGPETGRQCWSNPLWAREVRALLRRANVEERLGRTGRLCCFTTRSWSQPMSALMLRGENKLPFPKKASEADPCRRAR